VQIQTNGKKEKQSTEGKGCQKQCPLLLLKGQTAHIGRRSKNPSRTI
jgi:hypothetical protein